MTFETSALISTAVTVGFLHTILGPDHYLPFMALAHAGRWRLSKTLLITFLCGVGHILGAVMIGWAGMKLGSTLIHAAKIESFRNEVAAWAFILFGSTYLLWSLRRLRDQDSEAGIGRITRFLFVIFVVGPCEPLIPLLLYPAAQRNLASLMLTVGVFGVTTILTMVGTVALLLSGISLMPAKRSFRFAHAAAGALLVACGIAMKLGF